MSPSTAPNFGEKLLARASTHGRLCVGIDPHIALLEKWGLEANVAGLDTFSRICVEAFADTVTLVKPQVAFYEQFGAQGYAILERTIAELRAAGTLVVSDAKRGDIGSTMAGYARAWLDPESPLASDAVTVSPYLGFGSLTETLEYADATGTGVFVLAATSNPEARELQDTTGTDGRTIAQRMVDDAAASNARYTNEGRPGFVGVVVGATLAQAPDLTRLNGPLLLPGVGAQGAGASDIARLTGPMEFFAFPNVSRAILAKGPDVAALRAAVEETAAMFPGVSRD